MQPLPHDAELEKAFLGLLFHSREDIPAIGEKITPEHFYLALGGSYYRVMQDMLASSLDFDLNVMAYRMTQLTPNLIKEKALEFVLDCSSAYTYGDPMEIGREIVNLWKRREYIQKAQELATKAYTASVHIDEVDEAASQLMASQGLSSDENLQYPERYVEEFVEFLHSEEEVGIASRFAGLQKRIGGYERSNIYVFAGAEKMGKSAAMISEVHHFAKRSPDLVGIYFSLEMSHRLLTRRIVSIDSGVEVQKLKTRNMTDGEWAAAHNSAAWLKNSNLIIDTTGGITHEQIDLKCQHVISTAGRLDYIFVDYFQIMGHSGRSNSDNEKHIAVAKGLHALAKKYDIPVICGAQVLTKKLATQANMRPVLSDIRGSSALQAYAYWIGFLYRESYYEPEIFEYDEEGKRKTELLTRALREGEAGTDYLQFFGECSRFEAAHYETVQL